MQKIVFTNSFIFFIMSYCSEAFAYIGPGMAGGVLAAALGVILVIIIGIFAILFYPIKIFISKLKKKSYQNIDQKSDIDKK